MARGAVILIGGGWTASAFTHTYGGFAEAVGGGSVACVLLDDDGRDEYFARNAATLKSVGLTDVVPVFVSPEAPLQPGDLEGSAGILVGGGLTPAYHDAIVASAGGWIRETVAGGVPYAGFSAGAMIAPDRGIIGGWKLRVGEADLAICSEDVAEDLEHLEIRDGLGLVPFAVDVHASQYGTPTRLMHAVRSGSVSSGWAIDEDTAIEVASDGEVTVRGAGSGYLVRPDGKSLSVSILTHGERWQSA